jgi:DNA-binding LacI/PurR family transcriptional regulator
MDTVWDLGLHGASCRYEAVDVEHFDLAKDAVEKALRLCLEKKNRNFTGVICFNDVVAMASCGVFLDSGLKIPQDISVVGFDNVLAPLGHPRLTSVSLRLYELGRRATDLVLEMVRDEKVFHKLRGRKEAIPPELKVRKSTGPAPQPR